MATELPEPLRPFEGDACADLAARLWTDLRRIGISVHVVDGLVPPSPVLDGVVVTLNGDRVSMSWSKPDEGTRQDGSDQLAVVTHAAQILTNTVIGILSVHGYRVQAEFPEGHFGPVFWVRLDDTGVPVSSAPGFADARPELVPPRTPAEQALDTMRGESS
ncbi:hypothetical protein [Streptomyces sp. NPDC051572]|uniref:hypothetical protein n=1 Tax=Streptomyces sp. NPDC051572 TaxID=3155802 RepID=UPI003450F371